jgi:hypothetical protein
MSKTEKIVNYTPEMTAAILAAYVLEPTTETVKDLAAEFGKTTRSIIAKLSREGVYKKAEYVTKQGGKPETKETKVARIAAMLGVTSDKLNGLETATKMALDLVIAGLTAKAETTEAETTEGNAVTA